MRYYYVVYIRCVVGSGINIETVHCVPGENFAPRARNEGRIEKINRDVPRLLSSRVSMNARKSRVVYLPLSFIFAIS